jgi:hypothetical protein
MTLFTLGSTEGTTSMLLTLVGVGKWAALEIDLAYFSGVQPADLSDGDTTSTDRRRPDLEAGLVLPLEPGLSASPTFGSSLVAWLTSMATLKFSLAMSSIRVVKVDDPLGISCSELVSVLSCSTMTVKQEDKP